MYASVRKFRCRPDQVGDAMHRVDEVFAPRLEEMPGFVAYECIDCGDGTVCSMTICVDEAASERSVMMSAEFLRDDLADIEIERIDAVDGTVGVSRARDQVLEPAHA